MYKVITKFKDKNTKEIFEIGSEYKSKREERLKELEDGGYIEKQEEPQPPKQDKPKKK